MMEDAFRVERFASIREIGRTPLASVLINSTVFNNYERLIQEEELAGWDAYYLAAEWNDQLRVVLPVRQGTSSRWANPHFDPSKWGFDEISPSNCILVGNCLDLESEMYARVEGLSSRFGRHLLLQLRTCGLNKSLVFPFYSENAKIAVEKLLPIGTKWRNSGQVCSFNDVLDPSWERRLSRVQRRNRRNDLKRVEEHGLWVDVQDWHNVKSEWLEWLVEGASRHGAKDHVELVKRRYERWNRCEGVEIKLYLARDNRNEACGIATGLVYDGGLYMYEVGVPGINGNLRFAIYSLLASVAPLEYAKHVNLNKVHLGPTLENFKIHRGATARQSYYGVAACQ